MIRNPQTSTLFPTRRSSDLAFPSMFAFCLGELGFSEDAAYNRIDRKSTRLNSSHRCISYAVFCLKKKKRTSNTSSRPRNRIRQYAHPATYEEQQLPITPIRS